jgi:hypothetical protein
MAGDWPKKEQKKKKKKASLVPLILTTSMRLQFVSRIPFFRRTTSNLFHQEEQNFLCG